MNQKNTIAPAGRKTVEGYPEKGDLAGYFWDRHDDWLGDGGALTRSFKNPDFLRLKDITVHLLGPLQGKRILDVGCAGGSMMVYCGLQGAIVFGQDLEPEQVVKANRYLAEFHIEGEARVGDARELRFDDASFDCVLSGDFFEHIDRATKIQVLADMRRVLKPGGVLVIKTPNLNYLRTSLMYKQIGAIARLRNPRRLTIPHTPGTDRPEHIGLTTRKELTECLLATGFYNYDFHYTPLRRFGHSRIVELMSVEVPVARDWFCEDIFVRAYKPIALSYFPD